MNIQEFFNNIIESMPAALITVGADLRVKKINTNALRISAIDNEAVLGTSVQEAFPMLEDFIKERKVAPVQQTTVTLDKVEHAANAESADKANINLENLKTYLAYREIDFFLDSIEEGACRASNIVSNMLRFSKPESYSREPLDINLLLEQSINFALKDYEPHDNDGLIDTTIETKLSSNLPKIKVLPVELQQVFINLTRNAEQVHKELKDKDYFETISHESRTEDKDVVITITDNGNGMTDEVVRKAFAPYFTTRSDSGGTGLGLSTVYRTIKTLLGGEIQNRSAPKLGTQFIITLHACGKPLELTS